MKTIVMTRRQLLRYVSAAGFGTAFAGRVVADEAVHGITGTPRGAFSCQSEQRLSLLRSELDYARVEAILRGGLHEFLDSLQTKMNCIDICIREDFFGQPAVAAAAADTQPLPPFSTAAQTAIPSRSL